MKRNLHDHLPGRDSQSSWSAMKPRWWSSSPLIISIRHRPRKLELVLLPAEFTSDLWCRIKFLLGRSVTWPLNFTWANRSCFYLPVCSCLDCMCICTAYAHARITDIHVLHADVNAHTHTRMHTCMQTCMHYTLTHFTHTLHIISHNLHHPNANHTCTHAQT